MSSSAPADASQLIDQRRTQIVEEARRLFGERGTAEVSMDEIATHAGVARSTVYVYFANRSELLVACVATLYDRLLLSLAVGVDEDPPTRLTALVAALFETIDEHPAFFRLAIATQGSPNQSGVAVSEFLAAIAQEIASTLLEILEAGRRQGSWAAPELEQRSNLIGQQLFGALLVRATDPTPASAADAALELVDFVTFGLNPPPPRQGATP